MQENCNRSIKQVREYWEERAGLGQKAGSDDLILKQLEVGAISEYVHDNMEILEIGCGNGLTALELIKRFKVNILGIDYAERMVQAARMSIEGQSVLGMAEFFVGDVTSLDVTRKFDLVYSERTLINLQDWYAQKKAIQDIMERVRPGGVYVMCESCQDGLDSINEMRGRVGLSTIKPPWHNVYFRDIELRNLSLPGVLLEKVNYFSATYYFLSRVVNAWLAHKDGKDPSYDALVNKLALELPAFGDTAQVRIWLWRRI